MRHTEKKSLNYPMVPGLAEGRETAVGSSDTLACVKPSCWPFSCAARITPCPASLDSSKLDMKPTRQRARGRVPRTITSSC